MACQIPRLRSLLWALELLHQYENFFGITVLQFVGHLLSGSMMGLRVTSSKRTYVTCHASQVCCSQSPCPRGRPLLTRASTGDTQTLKGWSGSVSCGGLCSFPLVLVCTRFRLCPLKVCLPVLWKFCNQIPLASKVKFPGESQSLHQIPQVGKSAVGPRTFLTV